MTCLIIVVGLYWLSSGKAFNLQKSSQFPKDEIKSCPMELYITIRKKIPLRLLVHANFNLLNSLGQLVNVLCRYTSYTPGQKFTYSFFSTFKDNRKPIKTIE